jgi:hypothetical protein
VPSHVSLFAATAPGNAHKNDAAPRDACGPLCGALLASVLQALPLKCGIFKLFTNAFDADRLGPE